MRSIISIEERKFVVLRTCREDMVSDEIRESIKASNGLIDVVLSDGRGGILFCHEVKDVQFRDITEENVSSNE
jgi:hypothetical protein